MPKYNCTECDWHGNDSEFLRALRDKLAALDLDRLQEVLDYDPETGVFTWRVRRSPKIPAGIRAGTLRSKFGWRIEIDGVSYPAHHLAWFHFYGEPAEQEINFRNGNNHDASIANLRLATRREAARARRSRINSTTGLKGAVRFNSDRNLKKYRASIRDDTGKRIHLGQFSTPEEAHAAYCEKAKEIYGDFARLK